VFKEVFRKNLIHLKVERSAGTSASRWPFSGKQGNPAMTNPKDTGIGSEGEAGGAPDAARPFTNAASQDGPVDLGGADGTGAFGGGNGAGELRASPGQGLGGPSSGRGATTGGARQDGGVNGGPGGATGGSNDLGGGGPGG
jgi:hypothetical protein